MKTITTKNNFYTVDELTGTAKTNAIKNYRDEFINFSSAIGESQESTFETLMEEKGYEIQFESMTGALKNSKHFQDKGISGTIDWMETRRIINRLLNSGILSTEDVEHLKIANDLNTKYELNMEVVDNYVTVNDYFLDTNSYKNSYSYALEYFVPLHKQVMGILARFIGNEMQEIHNRLEEVTSDIHSELSSDEFVLGLMDGYMFDEHGNMAS